MLFIGQIRFKKKIIFAPQKLKKELEKAPIGLEPTAGHRNRKKTLLT